MGRPLNKKYFGNFNIGANGYTPVVGGNTGGDDGIGGEGIAGFALSVAGNYVNRLPTLATFGAPALPGGVQAAGVVHSVAQSASPYAAGTGYKVGDSIRDRNGTIWTVTGLQVASFTVANPSGAGNLAYDNGNVVALDNSDSSGGNSANWTSPFVIKPITQSGAKLTGGTIDQHGVWVGTGTPPASFTLTDHNTRGTTGPGGGFGLPNYGGTGDCNASGAVLNIVWGIATLAINTSIDYAYGTTYYYGTDNTTTAVTGTGAGAKLNVGFSPDHLAVTQKGSGYIGTETITFTTDGGGVEVRAQGTLVRTTDAGARDGGNLNVATNQDNAIIVHANVGGEGGTLIGDIQKQVGSRRYRIKTADGIAVCKLIPTFGLGDKECYIKATDDNGNTYFVKKLTAHRATLVRWENNEADWLFETNESAKWTFGNAQAGEFKSVQIENA